MGRRQALRNKHQAGGGTQHEREAEQMAAKDAAGYVAPGSGIQ